MARHAGCRDGCHAFAYRLYPSDRPDDRGPRRAAADGSPSSLIVRAGLASLLLARAGAPIDGDPPRRGVPDGLDPGLASPPPRPCHVRHLPAQHWPCALNGPPCDWRRPWRQSPAAQLTQRRLRLQRRFRSEFAVSLPSSGVSGSGPLSRSIPGPSIPPPSVAAGPRTSEVVARELLDARPATRAPPSAPGILAGTYPRPHGLSEFVRESDYRFRIPD